MAITTTTSTVTQFSFQVITFLTDRTYSFNGTSEFLQIESTDAINFGTNEDFTISVWVQADSQQKDTKNGDNDVVEKWTHLVEGMPYPYVIRYLNQTHSANGAIMVARYDGKNNPVITSKARINDGKFHHVVFARMTENGKGKLSLYIDGKLDGTTDDTTTGETKNNSPLFIGQRGRPGGTGINCFGGSVKELSFFKSSLSIEQIQQISTGVSITSLIEKWSTTVVTMTPSETTIVGPGGIYRPPTANKPVAYYPLNGNAQDASGNNVHGAEKGKITYAAGRIDQAAVFDGGSYIEVDDPFKDTTQFTIALWLKPTAMNDGGYHGFIGKQGDAYRKPGMWVMPNNNGLHYDSYSPTGQRFADLLNNFFEAKDRWVHVVWVKQGAEYRFYRNGELFATKPAPENFYTAKSSYWIGRVDNFFVGQIDDVRIYNCALSVDEIKGLVNSSLDAGLIAYYPLNGNAQDFSGNGCHGTEQNVTYVAGRMGQAASFNGASSVITATLPKVKKTYTVSMFAKFNNVNKENQLFYLTRSGQTDRLGYLSTYPAGQKMWHFGSRRYGQGWEDRGTTAPDAQGMQVNKWYHLAFVLNDQEISLFVDGALAKIIKSTQASDIEANGNLLFMLGGTTEKYQWMEGAIDEVRVYNRALTGEEVKYLATGKFPATAVGKIVVNADEWTESDKGYQQASDVAVFVTNLTQWFTGGRPGKFHAFSSNFSLTQSSLAETMKKAGHTWTVGTNIKCDLLTLLSYDGIFLAQDAVDNKVLIDYVNAGGNVYLSAGTGPGGTAAEAVAEADRWNKFLGAFGLKFLGQYNGISGNQAISSTHPIFAGVKALYQNNGNSIVDLEPNNPANQIVLSHANGQGLIAVYEGKKSAVNVGTTYLIRSKLHGFVLDIEGSNRTAGARVISYPVNGATGTPNQQWRFVPVPGSEGTYLISSVLNNFVIDITGSNTAPVTPIIAYPTNGQNGTPNQQWELVPVPNTENTFLIKTKLNGFVLDIEGSNRAAAARVISYPVNGATGTPNQHWEFISVAEGQTVTPDKPAPTTPTPAPTVTGKPVQGQWKQISGGLKQISVGSSQLVWGVSSNDQIWRYLGDNKWEQIPGGLKNVSVAADGTVFGVNANDDIFQYANGKWTQISGKLKQISVGSAQHVWGVNSSDAIYRYLGNNQWENIPGNLKNVSVAADGTVFGVNVNDDIYQYLGSGKWVKINGKLKQICVGSAQHVWGVNSLDQIWHYLGNGNWEQIAGGLKWVSVAADGTVYGVNANDQIWQFIYAESKVVAPTSPKGQGKIVVSADEWTLGNAGFKSAPDAAIFAANVAKWFVGNRAGKFHVFSNNFGLVESSLADAVKKAGHTWTVGTNIKFDLATVSTYDGIFLSGDTADNQVLIDYVNVGGNVYLCAGTGAGGAPAEADRWNKFLGAFGLKFLGQYNGISGNQVISSTHPIFAGVKTLYQNNGNSIVDLEPNNPANQIVVSHANGQGLIAVYEGKKSAVNVGTTYLIRSKLHGFVLDIEGSNRTAGARVISYPVNGATGTPNQQWRFVPVPGSEGAYLISSALNNFVIDITGSSTAPVTPIIAYPTNGQNGTSNQQWELVPVPNTENTFLIKTKLNGFVLDIEGSNRAAAARVISYPVNGATGTPNQHWEFVAI